MKFKFLVAFIAFVLSSSLLVAANGVYKIEDLYAQNTALNGKEISVKGEVIKISSGIMGKDWIHIQDNSKTPKKNSVIFTTKMGASSVSIGDKVIAKGTLKAKVDIGAGYFYDVLIEKSSFTK